jgi:hypothetical protein
MGDSVLVSGFQGIRVAGLTDDVCSTPRLLDSSTRLITHHPPPITPVTLTPRHPDTLDKRARIIDKMLYRS